jgi:hypothetical protein
VYFDQGESFQRYLQKNWLRQKSDPKSWAYRIRTVKNLDAKSSIPLQAADLIAWAGNRHYNSKPNTVDFWSLGLLSSIIMLPHYCKLYGLEDLKKHPNFFEWDGRQSPKILPREFSPAQRRYHVELTAPEKTLPSL